MSRDVPAPNERGKGQALHAHLRHRPRLGTIDYTQPAQEQEAPGYVTWFWDVLPKHTNAARVTDRIYHKEATQRFIYSFHLWEQEMEFDLSEASEEWKQARTLENVARKEWSEQVLAFWQVQNP